MCSSACASAIYRKMEYYDSLYADFLHCLYALAYTYCKSAGDTGTWIQRYFLKIELIKQGLDFVLILVALPHGPLVLAEAYALEALIAFFINAYPNKKLVDYGCREQMRDICPVLLLSIFMGVCVLAVGQLPLADIWKLLLQVISGVAVYFGGSVIFKLESFTYMLKFAGDFFRRK